MKNLLYTLLAMLALASCSKEEEVTTSTKDYENGSLPDNNKAFTITRSTIDVPISEFGTVQGISATINNLTGTFVYSIDGEFYLLCPGVTSNEFGANVNSIADTPPSPAIILKLNQTLEKPTWELFKIDQSIKTWVIRGYKIIDNTITLGDGNEIGSNEFNDRWKGDVWQGQVLVNGEIEWMRVTNDNNRSYHHGITAGDLNGDGLIDIGSGPGFVKDSLPDKVTIHPNIWINKGSGLFEWHLDLLPEDVQKPFGLEFADVTGDSRDEIILGGNSSGYNNPNKFSVYTYNDSLSKFVLHSMNSDNNSLWDYGMLANKLSAWDFNNDGVKDIIDYMSDNSGEGFSIWLGNGDGSFDPHFSKLFGPDGTLSSSEWEVFDANNDGYLDVLLRPNGYPFSLFRIDPSRGPGEGGSNGIKLNQMIWLNDGNGKFNHFAKAELSIEGEGNGRYFSPQFAIPYQMDNKLHYLAIESTYQTFGDILQYYVYDIEIDLN